ncbi:hypothetical protein BJ912DRAFT_968760 [Pholiota molesta]|nr:hypothetical protein BJ912DRAFT_968760 [Pholiota molesta]
MTPSPLLDSFDPFATHPFTNNSGIIPQPPLPSVYPLPVSPSFGLPSFRKIRPQVSTSTAPPSLTTPCSTESIASSSQVHTPQPKRYGTQMHSPGAPASPSCVFVPFRKEAPSPDLVLKKKSTAPADDIHISPTK